VNFLTLAKVSRRYVANAIPTFARVRIGILPQYPRIGEILLQSGGTVFFEERFFYLSI